MSEHSQELKGHCYLKVFTCIIMLLFYQWYKCDNNIVYCTYLWENISSNKSGIVTGLMTSELKDFRMIHAVQNVKALRQTFIFKMYWHDIAPFMMH